MFFLVKFFVLWGILYKAITLIKTVQLLVHITDTDRPSGRPNTEVLQCSADRPQCPVSDCILSPLCIFASKGAYTLRAERSGGEYRGAKQRGVHMQAERRD